MSKDVAIQKLLMCIWIVTGKRYSYVCGGTNRWIFSRITGIAWNV